MELTPEQYEEIKPYLPVQRGNVKLSNRKVLNGILYVAEQGCKWRGLACRFGNWHTIYRRMNRWAKTGVLNRIFEAWPAKKIIPVRIEGYSLDSTSVKVHPDGTGALKKRKAVDWKVRRRVDNKNPSACPRCWYGNSFSTVPWQLSWCAWRRSLVEKHRLPFSWLPNDYGSSIWRRHYSTAGCRLDVLSYCFKWPWSLGVWQRALQKEKWSGTIVQEAEGISPDLLSLRPARSYVFCFLVLCAYCRFA